MASLQNNASVYRPTGRRYHSTLVVDDVLYMWGGEIDGAPRVHDGEDKLEHTSHVDLFYLTEGHWEEKPTTGKPPLGVYGYSCTTIGRRLCYFGGICGHDAIEDVCNGYHNSINVLDTTTLHWEQLSPTTDDQLVMRKSQSRMITFNCDNKELLFILGGRGCKDSSRPQKSAFYNESLAYCYTNECNIFDTTTKKWSIPEVSGSCPPPIDNFSLNKLSHNRGIMFGGAGGNRQPLNDLYVIELAENTSTVKFTKLSQPDDPTIYWPKGRWGHAGTIITGEPTLMVVSGGLSDSCTDSVGHDSCIYNCATNEWQLLCMPSRWYQSLSIFAKSSNCVLLVMFGGTELSNEATIVEFNLKNTDNEWKIGEILKNYGSNSS